MLGPIAAGSRSEPRGFDELLGRVDHIVYAAPDLNLGIEKIENLLGVRATPGGQHPGRGTRNALVALGPTTYLEIIGPDPEQPTPTKPRWFGIDDLEAPRLVAWAAKRHELEQLARDAGEHGLELGQIVSGSRQRTDGVMLSWRYTDPSSVLAGAIIPFFIDWGNTPHPAPSAAQGVSLVDLRAEHPHAEEVQSTLRLLGLALPVRRGPNPALIATIIGPHGQVKLR